MPETTEIENAWSATVLRRGRFTSAKIFDQTRFHALNISLCQIGTLVGLVVAGVVQQDLERGAIVGAAEVRPGDVDERRHALGERRALGGNLGEPRREALERLFEHGVEDPVLAAEVVLHRAPGDARAPRDLVRGGLLEADLRDALDHRAHDPLARGGGALGLGAADGSGLGHAAAGYRISIARTM